MTLLSETVLDHEKEPLRAASFLGIGINYILWGVQIAQSYYYYKSFRMTDSRWLQRIVFLLFVVDLFDTIVASAFSWRVMVHGLDGRPLAEQHNGREGSAVPFLDAFAASIVQVIYAHKIWILLHSPYNYICTAIVLTLSCLQLTAGLGCTIFMFAINLTFSEFGRINHWVSVWLITAALTDILSTIIMTWKLLVSRTGVKETNDVISKLIRLIVETGLATASVQILDIIIYLKWPLGPYHCVLALFSSKVYSNSMMTLLNSRKAHEANDICYSCQDKPVFSTMIAIQSMKTSGWSEPIQSNPGTHSICNREIQTGEGPDDDERGVHPGPAVENHPSGDGT